MDNRRHYTHPVTEITLSDCEHLIRLALKEDAPAGDPTSESLFHKDQTATATLIPRESGILCGTAVVQHLFDIFEKDTSVRLSIIESMNDGTHFSKDETLMKVKGSLPSLLQLERIILNFLQYLSGIATTVSQAVKHAPQGVAVLDTRKTLPAYRRLAKYAVYCGGGTNHRIHLSEMALIKDNHVVAAGSIADAILAVRSKCPDIPLEVEVDNLDQLLLALPFKPKAILLDNMRGEILREAVMTIRKLREDDRPLIEVSGGWKPENLYELAELAPIGVSMGYLTHTTRFLDLSLDIQ